MRYRRTVEPTTEPVTLAEFKLHARVDDDSQDVMITNYLKAARVWCEEYLRRSFITTTWELTMDEFPCDDDIEIEWANLISVSSITYYDTSNTQQTFSSANYYADLYSEPPEIELALSAAWPPVYPRPNAVTVTFTAGYGSSASSVPQTIKQAILMLAAHWYENREPINIGNIVNAIPMTVESLLMPERWSLR